MSDAEVLFERRGAVGLITLNRPKSLNALTHAMCLQMKAQLDVWKDDDNVVCVIIQGAGDRAFCAGGDIRALYESGKAGTPYVLDFYRDEYILNAAIKHYPKPYMALIHGIVMGGGVGVSVHGFYRVVDKTTTFAMPETGIALFPDVGASYFLPRLPGAFGMFLALTGTRLTGADAVHAGLATHFVPKAKLPELSAAVATNGVTSLAEFAEPLPPFTLAGELAAINRCFSAQSVAGILARLAKEGAWGEKMVATLRAMSPSSVLWSFGIVHRGAGRDLPACLEAELRLTRQVTRHPDFAEGVRAMVIDKDRSPKWSPATIEAVDLRVIEAMLG